MHFFVSCECMARTQPACGVLQVRNANRGSQREFPFFLAANMRCCCWAQILNHGGAAAGVQTLLFSATLPSWVRDITKRFLQPGFKTVDLVGTDKMKANSTT